MKDINILKWKVKFILDFINGDIIINNKRKSEIVEQLEERKYPTLDKICKDHGDSDKNDHQYLLSMPIYNLTKDKIEELQSELESKQKTHNILEDKSENCLWNEDLMELNYYFDKPKKKTLKIKS